MGHLKHIFITSFCCVSFVALLASDKTEQEESANQRVGKDAPFERYQPIIDQEPFGHFDPATIPSPSSGSSPGMTPEQAKMEEQKKKEEEKLISSLRVNALITSGGITMVGFTDNAQKKDYYFAVGETKDGWTIKSANLVAQSVVIEKDGIEAEVKIGETSGATDKGTKGGLLSGRLRGASTPMTLEETHGKSNSPFRRLNMRRVNREHQNQMMQEAQANQSRFLEEMKKAREEEKKQREIEEERRALEREETRLQLEQLRESMRRDRELKQQAEEVQQAEGQ